MRRLAFALLFVIMCHSPALASTAGSGLLQDLIMAPDGSYHVIDLFNSIRRPNELVVYTPEFGPSTATVDAAVEMAVVDGKVTEIVPLGNNMAIPADGYVVSGHGPAGTWLRLRFRPGDHVEIRRHQVMGEVQSATHPIHQIGANVTRGANQLVIFTPGKQQTETNPWGIEAIIRDDVVVSVGGNDLPIPADGYVLSAHGTAKDWLTEHVRVGSIVTIDSNTLTVSYDNRSLLFEAQGYLDTTDAHLETAVAQGIPLPLDEVKQRRDFALEILAEAHILHEANDERAALEKAASALEHAQKAAMASLPTQPVAIRGAWYRQLEPTPEHIKATLDRLERAGVNVLFLETFYQGRTIYPSEIAAQHPDFRRWDPLSVWSEEAKLRGIDLHLWVHVFRFDEFPTGPLVSQHPDWLASGPQTDVPLHLRANRYSVDPAHPEVRAFVLDLLAEMITKYDVTGLHLDYVRYPKSDANPGSFSVTDYSRQLYIQETGIDPLQWSGRTNTPEWTAWQTWQEQQIASFVEDVSHMTHKLRPDLTLSAAVIGELGEARHVTRQNWVEWANDGLVPLLLPMLYNPDHSWIARASEAARAHVAGKALIVAGIGPFLGFTPEILVEQVRAAESAGSFGVSHYALSSLRGPHFAALTPGLYRQKAIPPYRTVEALQALGTALHASVELTNGPQHLLDIAKFLRTYETADDATLPELHATLTEAMEPGDNSPSITPWQVGLIRNALDIVSVAMHTQL